MCCPAWGHRKIARGASGTTFVQSAYRVLSERSGGLADISIGVIGAGGMGSRHVLNVQRYVKGAHVVAVSDLDQARAKQVAEECGGVQAFSDPVQLIRDADVAAVVIASPDPTHAEFVQECSRAHKPVLCEKPLATTAEAALSIVEEEQTLGRRLVSVG